MSVRTQLVQELRAHLLGPRDGANEIISSPSHEYMTGVLAPIYGSEQLPPRDVDTDADTLLGDASEDLEDDGPPVANPISIGLSPALDPSCQPRSLGISFLVRTTTIPTLDICATWARYERQAESHGSTCERRPKYYVREAIRADDNWTVSPTGEDVTIQLRCISVDQDLYRVSVFLLNIRQAKGQYAEPEDSVFQPQLRVKLTAGCTLESLVRSRGRIEDVDDDSLELLYRERRALARGHLCSAVWSEVDPERPITDGSKSPFTWLDGEIVPQPMRGKFELPDLRTEYLPIYPVLTPSSKWQSDKFGSPPELSALNLSEAMDPEVLRKALEPLLSAYRQWIGLLRPESVPTTLTATAEEHIQMCKTAATRIDVAIQMLLTDDVARLSFCFANRAIHEQNSWRGKDFTWRPFQLGFILLALAGLADGNHIDRQICDLLWFPTGGGKTEAYLGLMAFTLALRRLREPKDQDGYVHETGTGVLSRYTLRLLTIQQFRRAVGTITACEYLRVAQSEAGAVGWRPRNCAISEDYLWGSTRFSVGLWTGRNVTPNDLYHQTIMKPDGTHAQVFGAIDILQGKLGEGEPAQVIECPCCETILAVPQANQDQRAYTVGKTLRLHLIFFLEKATPPTPVPHLLSTANINVRAVDVRAMPANGYFVLSADLEAMGAGFSAREVDNWWQDQARPALGVLDGDLIPARASRPGYFIRGARTARNNAVPVDFEVYCPNPICKLGNVPWRERVPIPIQSQSPHQAGPDWQEVLEPFACNSDCTVGTRVPIPAITVDAQIYRRPPSLLVATVDKFARLAFEPAASALFGNVTHFKKHIIKDESYYGYCRDNIGPGLVRPLDWTIQPPDLILQDELHLIDGPLGSMVGLYETAIDALCEHTNGIRPKYIASTATVRQAHEQVQALFSRRLFQFPPRGHTADDSFFALTSEAHPAESTGESGRLYMGFAAPGKGAQTPIVRSWAVLLQTMEDARQQGVPPAELDTFWTLVGYFNAIRELAGAAGLFRQDIRQRVQYLAGSRPQRNLSDEAIELSSRADALILPTLLERLSRSLLSGAAETTALATSMFGTGVDVSRLGLMVVHGQPKSTSAYIQATGRVGRSAGGLVLTFLRASRPRDLDHYEFFTGYHRQLYRSVEPVTVAPFSPRARERALGPICTLLLRQARTIGGQPVSALWKNKDAARYMETHRSDAEVVALLDLLESRALAQPYGRRPQANVTRDETRSELDRWHALASLHRDHLEYSEYSMNVSPSHPVVLGDPQHQRNGLDVAYENAPQSLREVEATTGFKV